MATERLLMRDIRQILRLRWDAMLADHRKKNHKAVAGKRA